MQPFSSLRVLITASVFALSLGLPGASSAERAPSEPLPGSVDDAALDLASLSGRLQVGDLVFIRVAARPFREVAAATRSWTNHVGVVVEVAGAEPLVGESALPVSGVTPLSRFVARSEGGRVAVMRMSGGLSEAQREAVPQAARRRSGIRYDTGFDLASRGQFCSRYVREVLFEATGRSVGEVETFAELLGQHPGADLAFWKVWYFGSIPWGRRTVTPASVMRSDELVPIFDGTVLPPRRDVERRARALST